MLNSSVMTPHRLGYLLIKAGQKSREILENELSEQGIPKPRVRHFGVLLLIADGSIAQASLREQLRIHQATIVTIVDNLERAGLVKRHHLLHDRRANTITLTESGSEFLQRVDKAVDAADAQFLSTLTKEEQDNLRQILVRLLAHEDNGSHDDSRANGYHNDQI